MINPIFLSETNKADAEATLNDLFNDPVVILLVIGNSNTAETVLTKISSLINSDDHFFKGVRVVQAKNPILLNDLLSSLHVNPRLDTIKWDAIQEYIFFSITNVFNNIGDAVLTQKYANKPMYYIERSIFRAWAFDKNLSI
ncbi:hypothetical protein SAMN04487765_3208 [Tenacibaculum sp. MAR_2010_89]|uniref:hypothetical protein n=1 Tax=Tenacibaculum sp. MAR_2010_89 TaxID=1250198 RepID=UPI000894450F|nr:hypothetical protein [Tenacibaculum sp. MAR_2010_89]SEE57714.1 hypothetical protein SAMN04487765_3208 [Tenacibaculum sp. MAR_2010_89]